MNASTNNRFAVLARPLALEQYILLQLRIIQFLSRIEEDWTIDTETKLTPLECALALLEKMQNELDIDISVIEEIRQKIKEAAVIACLKNKEYKQANKILKTHMSKDPSSQKMRLLLQNIIRERNCAHPTVWNFSYKAFQQRILLFFESYLDVSDPFLLEMAKKNLGDKMETRLNPVAAAREEMVVSEPVEEAPEVAAADHEPVGSSEEASAEPRPEGGPSDVVEERPKPLEGGRRAAAGPLLEAGASKRGAALELATVADESTASSEPAGEARGTAEPAMVVVASVSAASRDLDRCPPKRPTSHGFSALREAFKILSSFPDADEEFSKLDEADWTCPKPHSASAFQAAKCQRGGGEQEEEASGTLSLVQSTECSISRLVMGSGGKYCWNPPSASPASSRRPVVTLTVQPAQPQTSTQPAGCKHPRLAKKRLMSSVQHGEKEVWSDEDEIFNQKSKRNSGGGSSTNTSICSTKKKIWTSEESRWIKAGVKKFGEGNWKAIFRAYPFEERTPVMIKDRWRTMKKLGLL
ncbi:telomeric repeat-binding factor 2 isoform X2 [Rhineura floridana]|uniref:telomeric repeat-binding factor 2 isoform X2 n=1 Tax=Rhineura floridana TaxID=261503 RepID=UPI002AC82453|nr:telomeric repeat-binding factor 2 isoform X2 [Rhineura floridana]